MPFFKLRPLFKDVKPGSQFFLFVCFWALFFVFFGLLSAFLVTQGYSLPQPGPDLSPEAIRAYKIVQLITSMGIFILPPLLLSGLFAEDPWSWLKMRRRPSLHSLVLVFLILFFALPLLNLSIEWNAGIHLPESMGALEQFIRNMEEEAEELTNMFLQAGSSWDLFLNVFIIALIPAVGEELLFRGAFQGMLHRWLKNPHAAIWLAAFIFSLLHFQFYGFVPRMLLGALFGYLLFWSGSLWVSIFAHFLNNASAVIISYFSRENSLQEKMDSLGADRDTWYYTIPAAVLFGWMMWFFYRENKAGMEKKKADV